MLDLPALSNNPDFSIFRAVPPRTNYSFDKSEMYLPDGQTPMFGADGLLVPPARSFSAIVNTSSRMYSYRFDEAQRDSPVQARSMRRDAFIEGLLEERYLPTINRRWQLEVEDDRNPEQVYVRDALTSLLQSVVGLDTFKRALLEGAWYGRAGTQWSYARNEDVGNLWGIAKWDPVHGDSVQFTFDGRPAILLDAMTTGWYSSHGAEWNKDLRYTDRGGAALVLERPYWRDRFAIHVHQRRKADYFEGELAGSVQGSGLRQQLYWQYVVRTDALSWMLAYMQSVGQMDLLVFNFPAGNAAAEAQQTANANKIIGKAAVICPRNPTGNWAAIEQISMNEAGLRALHELVSDYFDRHIERLIVGQSMSSGADKGTGLGGTGRADFCKACVPVEGSEILTRDGFKKPHDVQVGEEVLAYDAETDTCKWTPLLKKSFYSDCEVVRLSHTSFEAVCTPDHSWAVEKTRFASDWRGECPMPVEAGPFGAARLVNQDRYLTKAHDLKNREQIILAAKEIETENSLLTPTEAAVLGWVVTDGTIRKYVGREKGVRYSIGICQSKEEHFGHIRELMCSLVGAPHETVVETSSRTFPTNGKTYATKPQHWWYLPREAGTDLLRKCGFESRADIPKIVTRLSGPARRAMLDAMMRAEGSRLGVFTNTDPHVIEAFEILCALEGRATGAARAKKCDSRYLRCFDKTLKKRRYVSVGFLQTEDAGRADVWCPTTKYGTWVMRQNSRVMITGNTKDEILIHDSNRLDETLSNDVIGPLKRYNFPWAKFPVRYKSTMPDLDKAAKVSSGATLIQAGVAIKVDEWREAGGFTRPEEGDEVIGGQNPLMQMMQQAQGGGGGQGPPGGMTPPGMGPGGPGGQPMGAGAPGQLPPGSPLGVGGMAGPGGPPGGAVPLMSSATAAAGPQGYPNVTHGHPGHPAYAAYSPDGGMGAVGGGTGGGVPPTNGPAMYYPGGSNTFIPNFGGPGGRRKKYPPPKMTDALGFMRHDNPFVAYERHSERAPSGGIAHNNKLYRGGRYAPKGAIPKSPDNDSRPRPEPPANFDKFVPPDADNTPTEYAINLLPEEELAIDAAYDDLYRRVAQTPFWKRKQPFVLPGDVIAAREEAKDRARAEKMKRHQQMAPQQPPTPMARYADGDTPPEGTPDEREAFERAVDDNPLESTTHAVYADWLDENGDPDEAAFRRAMADWTKRGENVVDFFKPPGDEPRSFQVFPDHSDGFSHSVYRPHLPDWAEQLSHVGEARHAVTLEDPAVAYRPNLYWYHWRGYRPMEEGLRRAFMKGRKK